MHRDRSAISKKALDPVQRGRPQRLKDPKAEGLRNRGVNSVEDGVCASALDPGSTAVRMEARAGFSKLQAGLPFGALESPREIEIGKYHGTVTVHSRNSLRNVNRRNSSCVHG